MSKIDEYKNKINYDVWEDIYNMGNQTMPRESRSEYIVRKMQESRMEHTAPEEQKISRARNLTSDRLMYKTPSHLHEEILLLRDNVADLQKQLQEAYKRISELNTELFEKQTVKRQQLELDV